MHEMRSILEKWCFVLEKQRGVLEKSGTVLENLCSVLEKTTPVLEFSKIYLHNSNMDEDDETSSSTSLKCFFRFKKHGSINRNEQ